jgi:hypothetical protein
MSSIVIAGDTSGSVTLQAPAVSGSTVLNLPATSGTIQASGAGYTTNGVAYATSTTGLATSALFAYNGTSASIGDSLSGADGSKLYVYGNVPVSTQLGIKIGGNANAFTQQAIRFYDTWFETYAGYIGFTTNSLTFGQGTTEGMRLTSTGLGIGTSSPATKLAVAGGIAGTAGLNISGAGWGVLPYVANSLVIDNNGGETRFFATGADATTDGSFLFYTGQTDGGANERFRVTSSGDFCVGATSSTSSRLLVKGLNTASSEFAFRLHDSADTVLFFVRNDGYTQTGGGANSPYNLTTASAANLWVGSNGELRRSTSSLKYKTNVQDATHGLAKVMALRSVTYKGKNDGDTVFGGLIAEEVHDAGLTEFVQYAEDGSPDALAYGQMVSLAFKAIQEQQALITALTERITALEGV